MPANSTAYQRIREFLTRTMRTQHVYQPVMLKVLLENAGTATTRAIAAAFLSSISRNFEYYEAIARRMPGPVLRRHGIVEPVKGGFRFALPPTISRTLNVRS